MDHQEKWQISGEVFSAQTFFERYASGATSLDGYIRFTEELLTTGICTPKPEHGSLVWIDGIYGNSVAQEIFFSSLRRGEIPTPISSKGGRSVKQQIRHISPVSLITTPRTILASCGLVETVVTAAQHASFVRCAGCNALLTKYHSPLVLLGALNMELSGKTLSIYAESTDEGITAWATSSGLPIRTYSNGLTSVLLDRIQCGITVDTSIVNLLHSAWRIPNIRFTACDSSPMKPTRRYAPSGWCETCSVVANPPVLTKLREIISHGLHHSDENTSESLIALSPSLTVKNLLTTPISALSLTADSPLHRVCELLTKLSLKTCSLGTTTEVLDAHNLAKLSVIATILCAVGPANQVIIDIPHRIIPQTDVEAVKTLLALEAESAGITILGDPFSVVEPPFDGIEVKKGTGAEILSISLSNGATSAHYAHRLSGGDLLRIRHSAYDSHNLFHELAQQIATALAKSESSISATQVPVFTALHKSCSVVGEELGLLDPLAQLYAASLDARVNGLTPRDFTLFRTRMQRHICELCSGLGVLLNYYEKLPRPLATPCPTCRGARCKPPVSTALFRGVSFSTILNQSIAQSAQILTALSKASPVLKMVTALELHHLPLGMPTALLSTSELRRLLIVRALRIARRTKPAVIVFEAPTAGLTKLHQEHLRQLRDASLQEESAAWIEIY